MVWCASRFYHQEGPGPFFFGLVQLEIHFPVEFCKRLLVLIIAILVGVIPESGPHLIFVTLFAQGTLPFAILLANSIVQDGHGTLPLLAASRSAFLWLKLVNIGFGFLLGSLGLYALV